MYKILAKTLFVGKKLIYLPSCHSTNDVAAEFIRNNQHFNGAIVITDNQLHGKGRQGNYWEAEAGKNLTFSLCIKPDFIPINRQFEINIAVSVAIQRTLKPYEEFKIKWPNDVYYKRTKVGGILIQNNVKSSLIESSIIGIGLNCNQLNFATRNAASLAQIVGHSIDLLDLFTSLVTEFEYCYLQLKQGNILDLKRIYLNHLLGLNERLTFQSKEVFEGHIIGVEASGMLLIETDQGVKSFGMKEVSFLF